MTTKTKPIITGHLRIDFPDGHTEVHDATTWDIDTLVQQKRALQHFKGCEINWMSTKQYEDALVAGRVNQNPDYIAPQKKRNGARKT